MKYLLALLFGTKPKALRTQQPSRLTKSELRARRALEWN